MVSEAFTCSFFLSTARRAFDFDDAEDAELFRLPLEDAVVRREALLAFLETDVCWTVGSRVEGGAGVADSALIRCEDRVPTRMLTGCGFGFRISLMAFAGLRPSLGNGWDCDVA